MIRLLLFVLFLGPLAPLNASPAPHEQLEWRNLGPWRGGRTTAVAGIPGDRATFFLGATGGGVWRTTNAGESWHNVSDGQFGTGSIGAITIAPTDRQRVYVGTGESPYRLYSSSHGDGVYRSDDGGLTWKNIGLSDVRQIGGIAVSPTNADHLLVAAQGDPWAPSQARGIYRSTDGGRTWTRTLFVGPSVGGRHVHFDPKDPMIAYAATWDHDYDPWYLRSGGPGSGIWKSVDGGVTWSRLTAGLPPPDATGKVGIALSPVDSRLLWAVIESTPQHAGLYRSDDAGATWRLVNRDRRLHTRAWYYIHLWADPHAKERVFVLANPPTVSDDGGNSFREWNAHGWDFHALWIDPVSPGAMIVGSDGGASVTLDAGRTWSSLHTQSTAQLYRIWADAKDPYFVYASQQDNTSIMMTSDRLADGPDSVAFKPVGGGETGFNATHPTETRFVYATTELGTLTEYDRETGATRLISPSLRFPEGTLPRDLGNRYAVNGPVIVSWADPKVIYHVGNRVMRSIDRGQSWQAISPDLTRNDATRQGPGGGPFSGELINHYGAIADISQSPRQRATFWTGSNDGLVHVTTDDGATWRNVTPRGVKDATVETVRGSPHADGGALIAVNRMHFGDYSPYLYRTRDFGRRWDRLAASLPDGAIVRAVAEDPVRPGLIFLGTERGLYLSRDDGATWAHAGSNLPRVPVTGIIIRRDDLVLSTQGRGIWILDDISPLRDSAGGSGPRLLPPRPATLRFGSVGWRSAPHELFNRADRTQSAAIDVILPEGITNPRLRISTESGRLLRSIPVTHLGKAPVAGLNRTLWDLRAEETEVIAGAFDGRFAGPRVGPGQYRVTLEAGGAVQSAEIEVRPDPRIDVTPADFAERTRLLAGLEALQSRVREGVLRARARPEPALLEWEARIHAPQLEISQDRVNYGGRFLFDLQVFAGAVEASAPPYGANYARRLEELEQEWRSLESEMEAILARR